MDPNPQSSRKNRHATSFRPQSSTSLRDTGAMARAKGMASLAPRHPHQRRALASPYTYPPNAQQQIDTIRERYAKVLPRCVRPQKSQVCVQGHVMRTGRTNR